MIHVLFQFGSRPFRSSLRFETSFDVIVRNTDDIVLSHKDDEEVKGDDEDVRKK